MITDTVVDEYAEDMRRGERFPPIIIFDDGEHNWLADGYHRYYAARKAEIDEISAEFRTGTKVDALKYALSANTTHGLRRSQADRRRAVLIAIKQFGDLSNREIGRIVNVDDKTVAKYRQRHSIVDEVKSRIAAGDSVVGWRSRELRFNELLFISKIEGPYASIGYWWFPTEAEDADRFIDYLKRGCHIDCLDLAVGVLTKGLSMTDFAEWESNPLVGEVLELCKIDNKTTEMLEAIVKIISPWIAEIASEG